MYMVSGLYALIFPCLRAPLVLAIKQIRFLPFLDEIIKIVQANLVFKSQTTPRVQLQQPRLVFVMCFLSLRENADLPSAASFDECQNRALGKATLCRVPDRVALGKV